MRSTTFLSLVLVSAIGVGCGGASTSGLFDGPSGAGGVDAGGIDATAGHGGDAVDGAAGSPDTGAGAQDAGGGGTLDAGLDPDTGVVDAAPPVIDAGPPADPGVYCGDTNGKATYCKVGTACCVKSGSGIPGGNGGSTCGTTTTAPFCTGVSVECDDDNDCSNGQTCCGTLVNNNRYTSVRCATVCDTQSDTQVHFCDLDAAVDVCAADGMQCTASTLLPGYARCE